MAPENLEFNLVPDSILLRKSLVQKAKTLTAFGMLLMILLVTASFYSMVKLYCRRDTLGWIERELKEKEPAARNVDKMREIVRIARANRDLKFTVVNLFAEIRKFVPAGVTLDVIGIDLEKEKCQVNGDGGSIEDVRMFVDSLERSQLFKDVKDTTKKGETGAGFKFQIEIALEK